MPYTPEPRDYLTSSSSQTARIGSPRRYTGRCACAESFFILLLLGMFGMRACEAIFVTTQVPCSSSLLPLSYLSPDRASHTLIHRIDPFVPWTSTSVPLSSRFTRSSHLILSPHRTLPRCLKTKNLRHFENCSHVRIYSTHFFFVCSMFRFAPAHPCVSLRRQPCFLGPLPPEQRCAGRETHLK